MQVYGADQENGQTLSILSTASDRQTVLTLPKREVRTFVRTSLLGERSISSLF